MLVGHVSAMTEKRGVHEGACRRACYDTAANFPALISDVGRNPRSPSPLLPGLNEEKSNPGAIVCVSRARARASLRDRAFARDGRAADS